MEFGLWPQCILRDKLRHIPTEFFDMKINLFLGMRQFRGNVANILGTLPQTLSLSELHYVKFVTLSIKY